MESYKIEITGFLIVTVRNVLSAAKSLQHSKGGTTADSVAGYSALVVALMYDQLGLSYYNYLGP